MREGGGCCLTIAGVSCGANGACKHAPYGLLAEAIGSFQPDALEFKQDAVLDVQCLERDDPRAALIDDKKQLVANQFVGRFALAYRACLAVGLSSSTEIS